MLTAGLRYWWRQASAAVVMGREGSQSPFSTQIPTRPLTLPKTLLGSYVSTLCNASTLWGSWKHVLRKAWLVYSDPRGKKSCALNLKHIRHQRTHYFRLEVSLFPPSHRKTHASIRAQLTLQLQSNSDQSNTSTLWPVSLAPISFSFKTKQVRYTFCFTKLLSIFLFKYWNDISAHWK